MAIASTAVICTITTDCNEYAANLKEILTNKGFRIENDLSADKINYKIRKHSLNKTPLILVVGKNEAGNNLVSVRKFGSESQEVISVDELISRLEKEAIAIS